VKEFEEESYSDSFEEVNNTVETVRKRDVTNLLMTATAEQLDVLKQSLSNFKDFNKRAAADENNGDEYIEEIFED
jgi:gas vesicle protein